jgi:Polyketide cyclase / dehydrase and lipid transport
MSLMTNTIEIVTDPATAFAFVSDLRNEPRWNPECRSVTKLDDGPVGLGTRYEASWKGSPNLIVECVAYDPPRSWTNLNGGPLSIRSTFTVTPTPNGSLLTSAFFVEPHGAGRLIAPMFIRRMKRLIPQHLAAMKAILESTTTATRAQS